MMFPEHFDPRQDGRWNLQVGSPPCLCADVEQELVLFWRGDVEAGIMNGDGSRAVESIPADTEEKRHRDNVGNGLKKNRRGFLTAVRPQVLQVTFALARCFVAQAGAIVWTGALVTSGSRPQARALARPLRVEVCASFQARRMQRTMGTTSHVATWATERLVAHLAPAGCRVAHLPCRGRAHFQDHGHCNWIRITMRHSQRNNHTELAERRRARRRLLWSHRGPRQAP